MVTQGRSDLEAWVTDFAVYYNSDGVNFHPLLGADDKPIVFPGNSDQYTPVKNFFPAPVVTQFVQIRSLGFHNSIGLRFDLYGCNSPSPLPQRFAQGTPTPAPPMPSEATPTRKIFSSIFQILSVHCYKKKEIFAYPGIKISEHFATSHTGFFVI